MIAPTLSRRHRRRMQRLAEEADRAVEDDRRFFTRWPCRTYRVRLISAAERQQVEILQARSIRTAPDQFVFVALKQIAPGVRLKATVIGPSMSIGEELSDTEAGGIFEGYADRNPEVREHEAAMRAAYARTSDGGARP